jgi:hypothetical protein
MGSQTGWDGPDEAALPAEGSFNLNVVTQNHVLVVLKLVFSYPSSFFLVLELVQKPHEGPGEMGKPVVIPKEDQEKMKEMFKINQFNLMASEMIALNRSLPDVRLEG